ncbi:MAG: hypothetical protein ACI80K_002545, partial [Paracoccaceae bacterium]
ASAKPMHHPLRGWAILGGASIPAALVPERYC